MKCPICQNSVQIRDSFLYKYKYCSVCSGHFLKDKKLLSYPEEYFREKQQPTVISKFTKPLLDFFYTQRIKTIENFVDKKNPKILDYGCGSGKLVEQLKNHNLEVIGFEPSKGANKLAQRQKLPVYQSIKKVNGGYDLIMFWHSLEHIDKPFEKVKTIKKYLKKDGKLLIAVPNADSFEALVFKKKWFHWSFPVHRIQFTPQAIKIMLEKNNFRVLKIDYFSPEYTISGVVQSFLNLFLPKDVLYSVVAHRRLTIPATQALFWAILSILLIVVFSPFLLIFFAVILIFRSTGAMVVFAKNGQV